MAVERPRCVGVILAGGLALRFGGAPKGLERIAGHRIIDLVAAALGPVCDELLLVANDANARAWLPGVQTEGDVYAGIGTLGGLHAALHHSRAGALVLAWDMPFVTSPLLGRLRALGEAADAAVPWSAGPRGLEPLCAYYGPPCLPAIERRIAAGDRTAICFHPDVRVARMDEAEVRSFGNPEEFFLNINTPEQLTSANHNREGA